MDSDISSASREPLTPDALTALCAKRDEPVWVLAVRTDAFARVAWEFGRAAALLLERDTLRTFDSMFGDVLGAGDRLVHASGSDRFAFALLGEGRARSVSAAAERRPELAGIERAVSERADIDVCTGWMLLEPGQDVESAMTTGLERARCRRQRRAFATFLHDLATPVSSIHGVLSASIDGVLDPGTEQRFLESARSEAARIGRLIRGFIDDHYDAPSGDAHALLQAAMAAVEPLALAREVSLRLCSRSGRAPIGLPPDRALSLFVTLLENAIKHGRPSGKVTARSLTSNGVCQVEIDDDGPGIPQADVERIFSYGVRNGKTGGFGIGLAHARRLVEAHGGEICVERSSMNGARFLIRLPLASDIDAPRRQASEK